MKSEHVFAAVIAVLMVSMAGQMIAHEVGGRAPSPSPGVATATPAVSEMAPARPLVDGNGEDGGPQGNRSYSELPADPASTVTTQALVAIPSVTAYLVIDPVPATPVTTSPAVVTQGAESDIWGLIAASPWPQYLWGTVACLVERESGGIPWIVSPGGDVGLMQIGPANFAFLADKHGITRAMLLDGATNLAAGWILYVWWQSVNGDGWTPWASTRGGCA